MGPIGKAILAWKVVDKVDLDLYGSIAMFPLAEIIEAAERLASGKVGGIESLFSSTRDGLTNARRDTTATQAVDLEVARWQQPSVARWR